MPRSGFGQEVVGGWVRGQKAISCRNCAASGLCALEPLGSWIPHQWKRKGLSSPGKDSTRSHQGRLGPRGTSPKCSKWALKRQSPLGEALVKNAKSQDHRQSGNKARTSIFTWLPNGQLPNSKHGCCWTPGRASDSWMLPARPTPLQRGTRSHWPLTKRSNSDKALGRC